MSANKSHIENIKERTEKTASYKTIEILYSFAIATLLGGSVIRGSGILNKVLGGVVTMKWDLVPPTFALLFLAMTFFFHYRKIVILVVDSLWGELASVSLASLFCLCCLFTLWRPTFWPIFVVICLL